MEQVLRDVGFDITRGAFVLPALQAADRSPDQSMLLEILARYKGPGVVDVWTNIRSGHLGLGQRHAALAQEGVRLDEQQHYLGNVAGIKLTDDAILFRVDVHSVQIPFSDARGEWKLLTPEERFDPVDVSLPYQGLRVSANGRSAMAGRSPKHDISFVSRAANLEVHFIDPRVFRLMR